MWRELLAHRDKLGDLLF